MNSYGGDQPIRVLLVDDDEDMFVLTEALLSEIAGTRYKLDWAETYAAGMETIARRAHDVYLIDYRLGERTGLDLLRSACRSGCQAPMILLTGQGDRELDLQAMRAGAADYLAKDEIEPPLLERSIRYALERSRSQAELRESRERYAAAIRGANDGIWDWDLSSERIYLSGRWQSMVGMEETNSGNPKGRPPGEWLDRVHPDDQEGLLRDIEEHLAGRSPHLENEHRLRTDFGDYRWMLSRGLALRDAEGRPYRMAGSLTDISARKQAEQRLLHDAMHDPLTGLANRSMLIDRLAHAIALKQRRSDFLFALLFLDLDRFKMVNDSLGHIDGDALLREVASRLTGCARPGDLVARLGGDEFAILLDGIEHPADATRLAMCVHDALGHPWERGGRSIFPSASIGIALSSTGYQSPEEMVRDADIAMYRAKGSGRRRTATFDREMHESVLAQLEIESDLRQALEKGELSAAYQPVVCLETGGVTGFEALVRWVRPDGRPVSPADFIPVAEESGLVIPLDRWMLREACRQLVAWDRIFPRPLTLNINMSSLQFTHGDLVAYVKEVLRETGFEASRLKVEITETVLMKEAEHCLEVLNELRAMGIQLNVDDFGTGYSSLSYLHSMPVDALKIDRSFVARLDEPAPSAGGSNEIIRAILALARALNLHVVAEGVETMAQFHQLRGLGCTSAQGYLFSRPLPAAEVERLLRDGSVVAPLGSMVSS